MQREIKALEAPLPAGGSDRLQDEIERLRLECDRMVMAVEDYGPFGKYEGIEIFIYIFRLRDSCPKIKCFVWRIYLFYLY